MAAVFQGGLRYRLVNQWTLLKYAAYREWLRNPPSQRRFAAAPPPLNAAQSRVVGDLRRDGVASVRFDELFDDPRLWAALSSAAHDFAGGPQVTQALANWSRDGRTSEPIRGKAFLVRMYSDEPVIDGSDLWLRCGLDPRLLTVANAYLGLFARIFHFDVWYTIRDTSGQPTRGSQNWHRDPEDRTLLKAFLYFSDVSEGCGPLQYVRQSRFGERNCRWSSYGGARWHVPAEDTANIPPEDVVTCTGRAGTLVFCDTTGLHRGGHATEAARLLATWSFSTPASLYPRRFRLANGEAGPDSEPARHALARP